MTAKLIATLLTAIIFISCQTRMSLDQSENSSDTNMTNNIHEDKKITTNSDEIVYSDCVRGQAEPLIKRTVYPNAVFKLNPDNLTGTETVDLKEGERLIINNWGCEYFVLTFRFETERFQADTTNLNYWLDKAVKLVREIENGLDAPLDIEGGAISIENFLKENRNYYLGEEIVYDDDVIRDFVKIDRIQKIGNKGYAIEISFATGPL